MHLKELAPALPPWAQVIETHASNSGKLAVCIEADTAAYVPYWLELLGVIDADGTAIQEIDQYWLEVAYQCAKMDLQLAIENTEHDPRTAGKFAEFHFTADQKWKQTNYPPGRTSAAASQGREARQHFTRIRGRLPF
jgi:hypothetical protein